MVIFYMIWNLNSHNNNSHILSPLSPLGMSPSPCPLYTCLKKRGKMKSVLKCRLSLLLLPQSTARESTCVYKPIRGPGNRLHGRGGPSMWNGRGCSSEILNETAKGDQSGRGSTFFWPLKKTTLNFDYMNRVNKKNWKYIFLYIILRVQP